MKKRKIIIKKFPEIHLIHGNTIALDLGIDKKKINSNIRMTRQDILYIKYTNSLIFRSPNDVELINVN